LTLAASPLLPLLAACGTVVGPNYRVPEAAVVKRPEAAAPFLGASEKPFSQQALPAQWWRLYRDSTLDALVDQAFTANTDLRVAIANLARARAVLAEAEQLGRPAVDLAAAPGFGRAAGAASGVNHSLPDRASYDAGLHVSYQLDLFGKIARAVEAAHADSDSAQAASDLARVTVAAETTRAYAEACSAGRQIAIARQSVALQDKFVRSTAQRVKLGRGTALDNSRALGQRDQLRAAVPPLEAQRRAALYRLAVLTGETPSHFPQSVAACERVPRWTAAIPVGDGAALLRRRPDIRQAERTLAAATARIGVATAELYPQISLGLSAGSTGSLSGFGEGNTLRYSLGPLISWSLPSTSTARAHRAGRSRDARIAGALRRRRAERAARNGNGADQLCPRARPQCSLEGRTRPERAGLEPGRPFISLRPHRLPDDARRRAHAGRREDAALADTRGADRGRPDPRSSWRWAAAGKARREGVEHRAVARGDAALGAHERLDGRRGAAQHLAHRRARRLAADGLADALHLLLGDGRQAVLGDHRRRRGGWRGRRRRIENKLQPATSARGKVQARAALGGPNFMAESPCRRHARAAG
jgi:multidrug efflux system outer membrane protein